MSIARTARRRRRQYAMGPRGTEQIFGRSAAPHYAPKLSVEQSAAREFRQRERMKQMLGRKK